ncbi:MAG: cytochrome c4 [Gammaproteobacteria bacterium]|nr:cytochrome c4 [Gammaproteobacteria bacterium]
MKYKIQHFIVVSSLLITPLAPAASIGDASAGKVKSESCQGCHGIDGNSLSPEWPHLANQHAPYLIKQVKNFQQGSRINETMNAIVDGLSEQDIADMAAYFAAQKIQPSNQSADSTKIQAGRKIYKGGNIYSGFPACASCHGPNGVGNRPANFPNLAGQQQQYLIKTLNDFKSGSRNNDYNEIMRKIAAKMTASEITSVAVYITSLRQ